MGKGIAVVEHHVSTDERFCEHHHASDGFGERSVCSYCAMRERHGKRGTPIRRLPRCTLFGEWLEKEGFNTLRCEACKIACGEPLAKGYTKE